MVEEAGVGSRLGGRALLVADGEESGVIDAVRSDLRRAGVEVILFDEASEGSDVVQSAARLMSDSRALFVVGAGAPPCLSTGKAISLVAAHPDQSIDSFLGGAQVAPGAFPFLAMPTQCWSPLAFSDMAILTDVRDRTGKAIHTGIYADSLFFVRQYLDVLTEKQVVYDLFCIIQSCLEAYALASESVGRPLLSGTLREAVRIAETLVQQNNPIDRALVQSLGIRSAFAAEDQGVGAAIGWAAHCIRGIPIQWAATVVLPEAAGVVVDTDTIAPLVDLFGIENPDDSASWAPQLTDRLRSLASMADIPMRLGDLGITATDIRRIGLCAQDISGVGASLIHGMLVGAL